MIRSSGSSDAHHQSHHHHNSLTSSRRHSLVQNSIDLRASSTSVAESTTSSRRSNGVELVRYSTGGMNYHINATFSRFPLLLKVVSCSKSRPKYGLRLSCVTSFCELINGIPIWTDYTAYKVSNLGQPGLIGSLFERSLSRRSS